MIREVATVDELTDLLYDLNDRGIWPCVAVLDAAGTTALAYGIDNGDDMRLASLTDPGDDRARGTAEPGEGNYIDVFERDLDALQAPFTVMFAEATS